MIIRERLILHNGKMRWINRIDGGEKRKERPELSDDRQGLGGKTRARGLAWLLLLINEFAAAQAVHSPPVTS